MSEKAVFNSQENNIHFLDGDVSPFLPSSFPHDSSALSLIEARSQSNLNSTAFFIPTPQSKLTHLSTFSKKAQVRGPPIKSGSLPIIKIPEKLGSCGTSPKSNKRPIESYVLRVKEILDKSGKVSANLGDRNNKALANPKIQESQGKDLSRSKSFLKMRPTKHLKGTKEDVSPSRFESVSPIPKRTSSLVDLGDKSHEIDSSPVIYKTYWQDQTSQILDINDETTTNSKRNTPGNQVLSAKLNLRREGQEIRSSKLEYLFPSQKTKNDLTLNKTLSISLAPSRSTQSKILDISPDMRSEDPKDSTNNKRLNQGSLEKEEGYLNLLSFTREVEKLKDCEPSQVEKTVDNPNNTKLEEIQKLYKPNECDRSFRGSLRGSLRGSIIHPDKTRAEILQEVKEMDELKFNDNVVVVTIAKGKEIIQPNFMQKKGSMCYTELWGAKERSEVTKKMKDEIETLDLRHLRRDSESIYRPFKWKVEKSFQRKLPIDENDPKTSLVNISVKVEPRERKSQSYANLSILSGIEKISSDKTNISKEVVSGERPSKSLVGSRENSPISTIRAKIIENALKGQFCQKKLLEERKSILHEIQNSKEEDQEKSSETKVFKKKKVFATPNQVERMARFYDFLRDRKNKEQAEITKELKRKIDKIIYNGNISQS